MSRAVKGIHTIELSLATYKERAHLAVTMSHSFGPKGSIFLASYVESLFKAAGKQVKPTQLRDSVTFEV